MSGDRWLGAAGLALASASAALPWHVWSSPDSYARPRLALERLDDDPALSVFLPRREPIGRERLVTGTVRPAAPRIDAGPAAGAPTIVFATATHALARLPGASELTLLRPGSPLEGGDSVARLVLVDGRWSVRTARGRTLPVAR